jgi:hypothetical protein
MASKLWLAEDIDADAAGSIAAEEPAAGFWAEEPPRDSSLMLSKYV